MATSIDELPQYVRQSFTPDTGDDPIPGARHTDSVEFIGALRIHLRVFWTKKDYPYKRHAPEEAIDPSLPALASLGGTLSATRAPERGPPPPDEGTEV